MVVEFLKVFLPDRSSHRLLLPPAFVRQHFKQIRKYFVLEDFTGTQWRVEVERDGDNMFITNGWRDFVIDNNLKYGDFIVFTCHAKSLYGVRVFGKNSCPKLKGNGLFNVDDVAAFSKKDCRAEQVHCHSGLPRAWNHIAPQAVPKSRIDGGLDDLPRSQSRSIDRISGGRRKCSDMLHATPFVRAKAPFCIASLTQFNRYTIRIPPEPLRKYAIELAETVHLRDHNNKLWPVKVYITRNGLTTVLSSGWTHFRSHMKLECDDRCLFEFVLGRGNTCKELKTQVSYANARKRKVLGFADPPRSQSKRLDRISGEKRKRNEMLHATSLVRPDAPHCIISLKRYHLYTMRFPPQPLREDGIKLAETVYVRDHNDKLWPMKVYFSADGQSVLLSTGWSDFRRQVNLECGDQCLFEFVLEKGNTCRELKIQISYANQRKPKMLGSSFDMPLSQPRRPEYDGMNDEKPKAMLHVKPLVRPKAPHCIVFIKKYNLYTLHIPPVPLREHRIKLGEYVCLRDHNGELWPVKIYFSGEERSVSLSAGWTDFRRHVNLECGDQCVFEFVLVKGNICKEIKVEVFHAIRN